MITASTLSNSTLTVILDNGAQILSATKDHPRWSDLIYAYIRNDEQAMLELLNMKRVIEQFSNGGLVVADNGVFYKDTPLAGIDVDRIMAFMRQGLPYQPIANYMVRKMANPSRRAVIEMYNFLEHRYMPLTPEGKIIAYKGVQADFFSVSSGKEPLTSGRRNEGGQIFNGVGEIIEMPRWCVDDNFQLGCSQGLHAGSLEYARDWAKSYRGVIILIEIDPADVVSVPLDCNCSKLRCSKYKVIAVYNGPLPDTFTPEFSDETKQPEEKPKETPETPDEAGMDTCDHCGEFVGECTCDDETCEDCGQREDDCTCVEGETPEENRQCKKEEKKENPSIRERFSALICEQVGVPLCDIRDEKMFSDLGFDSLDHVELLMATEIEFNIDVSDEMAEKCTTVGLAIQALTEALAPKSVQPVVTPYNTDAKLQYNMGYALGKRNGIRRCKRLYHDGDETNPTTADKNMYIMGYNKGYRDGRKDYTKK